MFSIQFQKFRKNIILPKKEKKQMKKKSKNPRRNSDFIKRFKIMSLLPVLAKPLTWVFFFYISQTKCRIELPIMIIIFGLKHIYEVDKMI